MELGQFNFDPTILIWIRTNRKEICTNRMLWSRKQIRTNKNRTDQPLHWSGDCCFWTPKILMIPTVIFSFIARLLLLLDDKRSPFRVLPQLVYITTSASFCLMNKKNYFMTRHHWRLCIHLYNNLEFNFYSRVTW